MRHDLLALLGTLLLSSLALPAQAQDIPPDPQTARELEEACRKAYCRPARKVAMRRDDGSAFEVDVPKLPIVLPNGWITVFTGEQVIVEFSLEADGTARARAVPKLARPRISATFRLSQEPGAADSVLSVTHGFSQPMRFRLATMVPGTPGLQPAT